MSKFYKRPDHSPITKEFILERIKISDNGCWEWQAALNKPGYAVVWHNKKLHLGHRVAYELWIGQIPDGLFVCHKCDNPRCMNPDHLFIGNDKMNQDDSVKKGRHRHCVFYAENNPTAKFTNNEVRWLRSCKMSGYKLSKILGVSRGTINKLRRRDSYATVD